MIPAIYAASPVYCCGSSASWDSLHCGRWDWTKSKERPVPGLLIAGRIEEAARSFPREQLGVSTQCGFASVAFGNPITQETEAQKLRLVAEVAGSVWG